jgi:hypothetical protein
VSCATSGRPLKFSPMGISEVLKSVSEILANFELQRLREAPIVINFIMVEGSVVVDQSQSPSVSVAGSVGALTTGGTVTIDTINQTLGALISKPETQSVGTALKALAEAIKTEAKISDVQREELLEHLDELSEKAQQPKEKHKKNVIKANLVDII